MERAAELDECEIVLVENKTKRIGSSIQQDEQLRACRQVPVSTQQREVAVHRYAPCGIWRPGAPRLSFAWRCRGKVITMWPERRTEDTAEKTQPWHPTRVSSCTRSHPAAQQERLT